VFVHAIQNNSINVTRYTDSQSIPASDNHTVSGLSSLAESALEWYVFTDGTGTAFARGATTAYLTSTTNVSEWTHRTGNTGTYRFGVIDLSGVAIPAPSAPTLYPDDGGSNQIAFNNIRENDTTPIIRVSATHTESFNRYQVEFNTASDFGGTAYTETFSGTYASGTQYNLQTTGTLSLPSTDGVTYYVRVRASADAGSNWGDWSTKNHPTWTYTYKSTSEDPDWWQTTDEQFDTGTLSDALTSGSDSVKTGSSYSTPAFETGAITFDDSLDWETITFESTYSSNPVILAAPVTAANCEDAGTCMGNSTAQNTGGRYPIPVIRNVGTTSFDMAMCVDDGGETCAADPGVESETFHWFAFDVDDVGSYSWIDAGTTSSVSVDGTATAETFNLTFSSTPAVWTQAQTYSQAGQIGAHAWVNPKSTTGFSYVGCVVNPTSDDDCDDGTAVAETFGYVAIDTANEAFEANANFQAGSASIDDSVWTAASFSPSFTNPRVMVTQNTEGGSQDPQYPWADDVTASGMDYRYCEQDDATSCNTHNAETVHWFAVEQSSSGVGTVMSTEIDYDWFDGASAWNDVFWSEDETNGTVKMQVYYTDSVACDTIVPDEALSGNSSGFSTSPIDISGLSTSTYNKICLKGTLTYSGGTPYLEDWGVTVPENPYLLFGLGSIMIGYLKKLRRKKGK